MSNLWTHAMCDPCYQREQPGREPARLPKDRQRATPCCGCGIETTAGIFYRCPPTKLQCQAKSGIHERED